MLRVGLTGGLGSGKSTAAALFAGRGAHVLSSDEIARSLMQPGEAVYSAIVQAFGASVVLPDDRLDRPILSWMAFEGGRVDELNAIVHPATIARQNELSDAIEAREPNAVVLVESALIFETRYAGEDGWHHRFDKIVLVTAPEELRIARFIARAAKDRILTEAERAGYEEDAVRRMARQIPDEQKAALCDYVLTNNGAMGELEWQVDRLWPLLVKAAG